MLLSGVPCPGACAELVLEAQATVVIHKIDSNKHAKCMDVKDMHTWCKDLRTESLLPARDGGDDIGWIEAEQLQPFCTR